MNNRTQELLQRAKQAKARSEETLKRTAPKATLGGIKSVAEKRFGQRKTKKQQKPVQQKPKRTKTKQQKSHKAKSSATTTLEQWKQAMEKANIPKHRWRKLEDKISRLSGNDRKEIEEALFEHDMFKAVYSVGEDDPSIVDDYLSDLEEKVESISADLFDDSVLESIKNIITENSAEASTIKLGLAKEINDRKVAKEYMEQLPELVKSLSKVSSAETNLQNYGDMAVDLINKDERIISNPNQITIVSDQGVAFNFDFNRKLSELSDEEFEDFLMELENLNIFK